MDDRQFYSIDYWYPRFKGNTVKTFFIDATPDFVDYILSGNGLLSELSVDGIVLPKSEVLSYDDPRKVPTRSSPRESESSSDEEDVGGKKWV